MFNFGGSTSSSSSQSQSREEAWSSSVSGGASSSESSQAIAFEDVFARLFGGAEGAAMGLDPSMLTQAANTLFGAGTDFMGRIGGDAGSQYLESRLSGDNAVLQEQIDALGADLGQFFNEQILPGITSESVSGGTLGGGRQGVAQGMGAEMVGKQFQQGATALRAGDIAARDAAAGTLAGNTIQGAMTAFQGMPALAGMADLSMSAGMAPYERLAAILGGPTVLGSSSSSSFDFARALSESWGESSASSKSSSKSLSMGFSDRRLKRNIRRIGTRKGFPWYSWTFVWGEPGEGVMADEVPQQFVRRHSSGFDMVDYGALLNG